MFGDEEVVFEVVFELIPCEVGIIYHFSPELFEVVERFAVEEDVGLVCDVLEFMDELGEVGEVVVE